MDKRVSKKQVIKYLKRYANRLCKTKPFEARYIENCILTLKEN